MLTQNGPSKSRRLVNGSTLPPEKHGRTARFTPSDNFTAEVTQYHGMLRSSEKGSDQNCFVGLAMPSMFGARAALLAD